MSNNQVNWQLPPGFDLDSAKDVKCGCGAITYDPVVTLKEVPAEFSPTGKPAVIPIPVFKCISCGNINDRYYQKRQ